MDPFGLRLIIGVSVTLAGLCAYGLILSRTGWSPRRRGLTTVALSLALVAVYASFELWPDR